MSPAGRATRASSGVEASAGGRPPAPAGEVAEARRRVGRDRRSAQVARRGWRPGSTSRSRPTAPGVAPRCVADLGRGVALEVATEVRGERPPMTHRSPCHRSGASLPGPAGPRRRSPGARAPGQVLGVAGDAGEAARAPGVQPRQAEQVQPGTAVTPRSWVGWPRAVEDRHPHPAAVGAGSRSPRRPPRSGREVQARRLGRVRRPDRARSAARAGRRAPCGAMCASIAVLDVVVHRVGARRGARPGRRRRRARPAPSARSAGRRGACPSRAKARRSMSRPPSRPVT